MWTGIFWILIGLILVLRHKSLGRAHFERDILQIGDPLNIGKKKYNEDRALKIQQWIILIGGIVIIIFGIVQIV